MNGGVAIKPLDEGEEIGFRSVFGKDFGAGGDAEGFAGALLHADIDLGGGIFPYPDEDEARLNATGAQLLDALGGLRMDGVGDGPSVNESSGRH